MSDAVLQVRGLLQDLAREHWSTIEDKHVRNVSWVRGELKQIARTLELKAFLENKPAVPKAPYPSPQEDIFRAAEPAKKKQKTEKPTAQIDEPLQTRRASTRLSMRLRTRPQSVEPIAVQKSRKRGRPSEALLEDPAKLKVVELRSELKKRGLRTSGVKAVLFDRLLDALEKEQKDDQHLKQVQEEPEEEKEAEIIFVDEDEDEIVRESVGSNKSPGSQPVATEEKDVEVEPDTNEENGSSNRSSPPKETPSTVLETHQDPIEVSQGHDVDSAEEIISHDEIKWTRRSMQTRAKSELTSPLAWKRKSILRKASSLAPSTRTDRKVSFAPNDEVNMIVESSQTDSSQPEPSPEKAPSLPEVHTPREENKQTRSESLPEAEAKATTVTTPVAPSSTSTTPEDRPVPELETEEQRRKREFDETVQREAQRLRAAAKLSAQKRLEDAKASKAFWAKHEQMKAKLRASNANEKRKSSQTPVPASEKAASDQVSPPTSEAAESNPDTSLRMSEETRPQQAEVASEDPEEAKDNDFMRSMARHQELESISEVSFAFESSQHEPTAPQSAYSAVEDKSQAERSMVRPVADKTAAKSVPLPVGKTTELAQNSSRLDIEMPFEKLHRPVPSEATTIRDNKSDLPAAEPQLIRDRSDSLSSTVSSIPEPSVVENALKSGATDATSTRKPITNLVSGLHSFTTLLEKENSTTGSARSAPVVNALKLAEKSRVAEEKKRLEKERRKAILKQKMEEHKKAAALKEQAEKEAQAKREQERQNERKKREAELAKRRQQKLKEMRAGLEKKRAMLAAEKKSRLASSAALTSKSVASSASASQHKHRGLANASESAQPIAKPHHKHVPASKPVQATKSAPKPLSKPVSRPPPAKLAPKSPEVANYEMSDHAPSSDSDNSDSDSRRHGKKVPKWAQKDRLNKILHAQFGRNATDPSPAIFQDFVDTCNLEAIFETADVQKKKKFARRTSSGNWLADRPTARDRALYQRDMGYER